MQDFQKSPLREYLEKINHNLSGPLPVCLQLTDSLVLSLCDNLDNVDFHTSVRLFHLAFSSWRNGILLSQSGASSQVPLCLRHAIETCAYSYLFSREQEWEATWWNRESDQKAKAKLRNARSGPLSRAKQLLLAENKRVHRFVCDSLDHFIDFGAHPNVFQLVDATKVAVDQISETHFTALLGDDGNRQRSLISCLGVGFMLTDFFEIIWPDTFKKLGADVPRKEAFRQAQLYINAVNFEQNS